MSYPQPPSPVSVMNRLSCIEVSWIVDRIVYRIVYRISQHRTPIHSEINAQKSQ
jgi:hypothetical protein